MPGSRLTLHDRHMIALGLAGGRSYSDIADALGRQVSTISREVVRNGGRDRYRAETAQRATELRSQRNRRNEPHIPAQDHATVHTNTCEASVLEARLAAVITGPGLPATTARVAAALYTSTRGRTAADLAAHLSLSRACIAGAVRDLEDLDLITRTTSQRQHLIYIDTYALFRGWLTPGARTETLDQLARRIATALGAMPPDRANDLDDFFDYIAKALQHAAQQWHRRHQDPRTAPAPELEPVTAEHRCSTY